MEDFTLGILSKIVLVLFIIVGVIGIIVITRSIYTIVKTNQKCEKWEEKIVWQKPYTYFIPVGKLMVPTHSSGKWVPKKVCVKVIN